MRRKTSALSSPLNLTLKNAKAKNPLYSHLKKKKELNYIKRLISYKRGFRKATSWRTQEQGWNTAIKSSLQAISTKLEMI